MALENNKNAECHCQPKIQIYSEYEIHKDYYKYDEKNNLVKERRV